MLRPLLASVLFLLSVVALGGCGSEPQIGGDKEAFKTVDALYTAVGLKDVKLVDQCGEKLKALREAGKLSAGASDILGSIIAEAHDKKWESAQTRLSQFMEGQH